MPSRRELLVATGLAGLGAVGASQVRLGPVDSWTPPPDAWPLRRYDPANTAANPDASPPSDPSVSWTAAPLGVSRDGAVVADRETVYAAGNGVAALDRTDGTVVVATAGSDGETTKPSGTIRALRAGDGSEVWRIDLDDAVLSIAPVDGTIFAATLGGRVIALR